MQLFAEGSAPLWSSGHLHTSSSLGRHQAPASTLASLGPVLPLEHQEGFYRKSHGPASKAESGKPRQKPAPLSPQLALLTWHIAPDRGWGVMRHNTTGGALTQHPATLCLGVFCACAAPLSLSAPVYSSELPFISLPHGPKNTTDGTMSGTAFGPVGHALMLPCLAFNHRHHSPLPLA